jgi:hypothetical protein
VVEQAAADRPIAITQSILDRVIALSSEFACWKTRKKAPGCAQPA